MAGGALPFDLEALVDAVAERLAEKLSERAGAGRDDRGGWVDAKTSPLGARKFRALAGREFPASRIGKRIVARAADVDAYIASHPHEPGGDGERAPASTDDWLAKRGIRPAVRRTG